MKINFNTQLVDLDGKPIENAEWGVITLKRVAVFALLAHREKKQTPTKELEDGILAEKIHLNDELDLTTKEVVSIQEALDESSLVKLIKLRARRLLEQKEQCEAGSSAGGK